MIKLWVSVFLVSLVFFISCGNYETPEYKYADYMNDYLSGSEDSSEYAIEASGALSADMQSIEVQGRVVATTSNSSKTRASSLSNLKVKVTRVNTNESKTASTTSGGEFSTSFDEPGNSSAEDFEVGVVGSNGSSLSSTETIEADLTGEWGGELTITSMDSACENVPVVTSLDTEITVEQVGSQFTVYLGAPLNLFGIDVNVSEDLAIDGEGSVGVPSSLARFINCYAKVSYSFVGDVDPDTTPPTFDVDFEATLSGVATDCSSTPESDCRLMGIIEGEKE